MPWNLVGRDRDGKILDDEYQFHSNLLKNRVDIIQTVRED
jgi:hypothetical protein